LVPLSANGLPRGRDLALSPGGTDTPISCFLPIVTLHNMAGLDFAQKRYGEARAKLERAIVWQRRALAVNPNHAEYRRSLTAHLTNLIVAADGLNDPAAAAEARCALDELNATDPHFAALDTRLVTVLEGEARKDIPERLTLARHAYATGRHSAAVRLWSEALERDPRLADDREAEHRYNAACSAALAGVGKSKDDPAPDEAARSRLRDRARALLVAELAAWAKLLESAGPPQRAEIVTTLERWLVDADLAGVRDPEAIDALPGPERDGWRALWKDVAAALARAKRGKP
jgi:tetratricopeptide (TPR) repeat protein